MKEEKEKFRQYVYYATCPECNKENRLDSFISVGEKEMCIPCLQKKDQAESLRRSMNMNCWRG